MNARLLGAFLLASTALTSRSYAGDIHAPVVDKHSVRQNSLLECIPAASFPE